MALLDDVEKLVRNGHPDCSSVAACLAEMGSPSASIALWDEGVFSTKCYSPVGYDTETIYQACSISKPVTGLAIMRLVDQGRLAVDNAIKALLPKEALDTLTEGCPEAQKTLIEGITIKQLMSHTSGLSQGGFPGYPKGPVATSLETLKGRSPSNTPRVRLTAFPGQGYSYSGGGMLVLQLILEHTMGTDFPSLMQELVLKPLEMTRSFYGQLPASEPNAAKAHYTGYRESDTDHHIMPELAADGLWTTPTDLLKVAKAVQQSLAGDAFLRKETAKLMLTEVDDNMGLSWVVPAGGVCFSHAGSNMPGFECILMGFADLGGEGKAPRDTSLAIMTNSALGIDVCKNLCQAMTYLKKWPMTPFAGKTSVVTPLPALSSIAEEDWKPWAGKWKDEKHSYELAEKDGGPAFSSDSQTFVKLVAAALPSNQDEDDGSAFILEGFDLVVQLQMKEGERTIILRNGLTGDFQTLKVVSA